MTEQPVGASDCFGKWECAKCGRQNYIPIDPFQPGSVIHHDYSSHTWVPAQAPVSEVRTSEGETE